MELLFYLAISLLFNYLILTIAYLRQSDKYTDLAYALTFIVLIFTAYIKSEKLSILGFINIFLVFIWAFRLGSFLLLRISKIKRDERFNNIRKNFLKFFAFFTIQALTAWVVLFSTFVIAKNQGMIVPKSIPFVIICILSLILEHQSDMQKFIWKAKGGRGLIKNGWYSMCRYPNYLGEMSFWTSLSILAIFNLKTFNIYYVILTK